MTWVTTITNLIASPTYVAGARFTDIHINLNEIYTKSSLDDNQIDGCSVAAAFAAGNHSLWNTILLEPVGNPSGYQLGTGTDLLAGIRAGALATQQGVYQNFTFNYNGIKGLPDRLRKQYLESNDVVAEDRFMSYMLSASLVESCNGCIVFYANALKDLGYSAEQIRDIARVASVLKAASRIIPSYTAPSGGGGSGDGGGL